MNKIIEARGLAKYYGTSLAVDNIDFSEKKGEIFGFLRPLTGLQLLKK